jgi:Rod binding domain-containing protein
MTPIHAAQSTVPGVKPETLDPKVTKAAQEFEAIFVRTMLKSLEKVTGSGQAQGGIGAAGQSTYGSLVVGTVADAVSAAGGLGLADLIARHLASQPSAKILK